MRDSLHRIYTLAGRNVKEIMRDPLSLIFTLGMPLGMEILFYFLFHGMTAQFEMKFLAPGIVVFSQAFLALFAGLLIAQDRSSAFLTRLYVSRARSHEFIFGYALSMLPLVAVQSVLFFVVGGIIDSSIWSVGVIWCVLLSLVTALFYVGMGILLGSLCTEKSIGGVASIVIAGQSLLSGMWFPPDGLNDVILTIMRCLPFKNATELMQRALVGFSGASDFFVPFAVVLGYTVVVIGGAIFAFARKMRAK